eukprot:SAG31_NODE_17294_length_676_cov_1.228769_1_plen_164_part_00
MILNTSGAPVLQFGTAQDTPLAHYNVTPAPNSWPPQWWPLVTARHLLGQVGGCVTGGNSGVPGYEQCYSAPGTNWTYDSEVFIGHLSKLIGKTAGMPALEWAKRFYAAPLGVPGLYDNDGVAPDFSAGGGQVRSHDYTVFLCPALEVRLYCFPVSSAGHRKTI